MQARRKQSRASTRPHATSADNSWVSTLAGIVELAQALCGPSSASSDQSYQKGKGARDGVGAGVGAVSIAEGWDWAAPLALARPLFDVLPALLTVATTTQVEGDFFVPSSGIGAAADVVDSAEYSLWLTMDVLGAVLRRWGKGGSTAEKLYEESRAGEDSEKVLACVKENPSPQTR